MLEKVKRYTFQYIILTSLACFIFTLYCTKNPFISILTASGGGVPSLDMCYIFYVIVQTPLDAIFSFIVFMVAYASFLPCDLITKYVNIGIVPAILYIIFNIKYDLGYYLDRLYDSIVVKYYISYCVLSTFIVNLHWSTLIREDNLNYSQVLPMIDTSLLQISFYLQGGLSLLNNKVFLLDKTMLVTAVMSHFMTISILSILYYYKRKSTIDIIKANLVLHLLITALTIGAYIVNLNIIIR